MKKQDYILTQVIGALLLITAIYVSYVEESENMAQNPVPMIDSEAEDGVGQIVVAHY